MSKERIILTNLVNEKLEKKILNVKIKKLNMDIENEDIIVYIELLEILENINQIEEFNKLNFYQYIKELNFNNVNCIHDILKYSNYKKRTIANLKNILDKLSVKHQLDRYLNNTSSYNVLNLEDLNEITSKPEIIQSIN